ncbi:MAG: glutathione S-transferase family protein [Myxococcales bacterium]|nr:glutathione S-transferase family protein [Myxococcales bacterium]
MTSPVLLQGVPNSPYTRKMLALLRYRRIAYEFLIGVPEAAGLGASMGMPAFRRDGLPAANVGLAPTFYWPDASGTLTASVDSTPIIRRLEREHAGRSVLPSDPVLAFLDYLLEEYADEWLTKSVMHFRWYHPEDIEKAGAILPLALDTQLAPQAAELFTKMITKRQTGRLHVVGSNETTRKVIESSYVRFLKLFSAHLEGNAFLMGARPGASDFAVFGQLTQLTQFDPTPMALTLAHAPRVFAWVEHAEDLCGAACTEDDWVERDAIPETLLALLAEMGRTYVPVMLANEKAINAGHVEVRTEVDGTTWVQDPFPYQGKCLAWVRDEHRKLSISDRTAVDGLLQGTGCEALVQ